MIIDISTVKDIKGASIEVELEGPPDPMAIAGVVLKPVTPVHVVAKATSTGHSAILVQGKARAEFSAECHRCLREFVFDVETEFQEQYHKASHMPSPMSDYKEDEVLTYNGDFVDISKEVNSHLALSLPIQLICSSECKGLCPVCGKDLNDGECACSEEEGDIRLAPLAQLYPGQDKDEF
jgi:uncharacterized protein